MQRQAILFLVHANSTNLCRLVKLLDSKYFDFIFHVDASTNLDSFLQYQDMVKESNIYFVEERVNVRWGDYSIVEAEIKLLENAIKRDYKYYHLLSGADFVLKNPKEIYSYFNMQDKEFIQFWDKKIEKSDRFIERYKYYNPEYPKKKTFLNKSKYHITRRISVFYQKMRRVNRLKNIDVEIKMGAQWFSITHELALYLVQQEKLIESIFMKTQVPDESFLQTLAYNSRYFRDRIFDLSMDNNYSSVKREIYFVDNKVPHVWTIEDKEYLLKSDNFFARKFDPGVSDEIVDLLEKEIIESS